MKRSLRFDDRGLDFEGFRHPALEIVGYDTVPLLFRRSENGRSDLPVGAAFTDHRSLSETRGSLRGLDDGERVCELRPFDLGKSNVRRSVAQHRAERSQGGGRGHGLDADAVDVTRHVLTPCQIAAITDGTKRLRRIAAIASSMRFADA